MTETRNHAAARRRTIAAAMAGAIAACLACGCGGDAFSAGSGNGDAAVVDGPSESGPSGDDGTVEAARDAGSDAAGFDATPPPDATSPDSSADSSADGPYDAPSDSPSPPDGPITVDASEAGIVCPGVCVSIPQGWTLVEGSFGSTVSGSSCSAFFAGGRTLVHDTLSAPQATCSCSCDGPTGATCEIEVACATGACGTWQGQTSLQAGSCIEVTSLCGASTDALSDADGTLTTQGTCAAQPKETITPATWGDTATLCQPSGQLPACGAASSCAPPPDSGFALCIQASGALTCPSGWSDSHLEYGGVSDFRGCSTCSCGAPTGGTCGGEDAINYWAAPGCPATTPTGSFATNSSCVSTVGMVSIEYSAVPTGGACTPSPVSPTGSASPTGPVTVCCQP
jgi:hypothetical protein